MFSGIPIDLPAMLAAREERAARQDIWLKQYACPILSFTLNIPGPVKTSPDLRRAFDTGLAALEDALESAGLSAIARDEIHAPTGDEALLAIRGHAAAIKEIATKLEEDHPLGRLFDMDVLNADGTKLSRRVPRRCLLCAEQAQNCARSRRHTVAELTAEIKRLLIAYLGSNGAAL